MPPQRRDQIKEAWQMHYDRVSPDKNIFGLVMVFNDGTTPNKTVGQIDCDSGVLTEYPFNTQHWNSDSFLKPKYDKIGEVRIQLPPNSKLPESEDIVEDEELRSDNNFWGQIPDGLYYGFRGGLGLYFRNDFIIKEIEAVCDCDVLAIGFSETPLAIKGNIFSISSQHFLEWIKEIDRIRSRGNGAIGRVKSNFISNDIAKKTGGKTTELRYGRNVDSKYITHMTNNDLSDDDAEILIQSMVEQASNSNVLKEKIPALKRKIEIASLDTLIEHFQAELPKSHSEGYWQSFFEANLFALQQILSTPFTLITPHAHVETGGLLGNGAKITDYFGKNPVSSNVCIIEIKKPTTRLINKSRYREGLYAASKELSGSIVQITDQANSFVSDIYKHKSQNPSLEIEAHNIRKCILIGNTDEFGNDKGMLKSFELYRQTCANVDIVTYNEALEQLKILRAFLISESE